MSLRILFASVLAACVFACAISPRHASAADTLIWRGDQATGRAIMEDIAKLYAKDKIGKIVLQQFSTVSGLDAVADGSADIGGSARGKYAKRAQEANINFVPVALDAVVPITHPRNPVSGVTLKQLHDIYFGRITNWKELGGEDKPINLYGIAAPQDGIEFSMRELMFDNGDQRVAAPRLYINTAKLEEAIELDPAGLGLSTLANVYANPKIKMLSVEGVSASMTSVANATYPLYITLYSATRVGSPKQAEIDRYLAFLSTPAAKEVLRRHQLVPYADGGDMIARNAARVAFISDRLSGAATSRAVVVAPAAPTPVSAPRATLGAKMRIAPTAESTEAARANLARAEEKKATAANERALAARLAREAEVTKAASARTHAPVKVASAKSAKAPVKKSTKPAVKAAPKKEPAPPKPAASFGNVNAGASGG